MRQISKGAHETRITNLCNTLCKQYSVECELYDSICARSANAHAGSIGFDNAKEKKKNKILWVVRLCPFVIASNDREQQRLSNNENRSIPLKFKFCIECVSMVHMYSLQLHKSLTWTVCCRYASCKFNAQFNVYFVVLLQASQLVC